MDRAGLGASSVWRLVAEGVEASAVAVAVAFAVASIWAGRVDCADTSARAVASSTPAAVSASSGSGVAVASFDVTMFCVGAVVLASTLDGRARQKQGGGVSSAERLAVRRLGSSNMHRHTYSAMIGMLQ